VIDWNPEAVPVCRIPWAIRTESVLPQGDEQPQGGEHLLTGPVTLYEVAAVRETFRTALAEGKSLRLDLSDSGPWDIAGLQLLIACVKSGRQRGQDVRIINVPRPCADLAQRYGLSDWLRSVGD
jgi:ABC-type transporter Mla MlaB component